MCGSTQYIGDLVSAQGEGCLHAAFLRSPEASAKILSIDTSIAAKRPGVYTVLTGREISAHVKPIREQRAGLNPQFQSALNIECPPIAVDCMAIDRVRYVGEPVAVVVAADRYIAEDALRDIVVEYDVLTPVVDPDQALVAGAPLVHATTPLNTALRMGYEKSGEPLPQDLADCVVVEATYRIARQTACPIECRGVMASPREDGGVDVWTATQGPQIVRRVICAVTDWPVESVRVFSPDIGGAFGQKANVYGEEIVIPFLAKQMQRNVAWIEDRYENLVSATQGRDQVHQVRLVTDRTGRILKWEDDFIVDLGVYNFSRIGVVTNTAVHLLGAYRIPNIRVTGVGVYTNKAPTSQFRGAGRPEATFALERSLDAAARKLGISAWDIREINILNEADLPYEQGLPYRDGSPIVYDGKNYRKVLDDARKLIPADEIVGVRSASCDPNLRIGFGLATCMEATGRGPEPETARVTLDVSGCLTVKTGVGVSGQSHRTVFAQIAADAALVEIDQVVVTTGDSDGVPASLASIASRSAVLVGSAVLIGVQKLVEQIIDKLRDVFEANSVEHVQGGFMLDGQRFVSWSDVGKLVDESNSGRGFAEAIGWFAPAAPTWIMAAHVALVQVDIETGVTKVLGYGVAHENSPALNPRVADGQVRGGVAQGIGSALLEHFKYDEEGQPTTANLADYHMPSSLDVPSIRIAHSDVQSDLNPLGIRGIGESGPIASTAAIASAIDDALLDIGVVVDRSPASFDFVLDSIIGAQP